MPKDDSYLVLVCGWRDYKDRDKVFHVLDALHSRIGPRMMIISGGASGADDYARQWAVLRKVDHLIMYAKWGVEHRSAGPIRNRRMLKRKPRLVCAFHPNLDKSKGTADMINAAEKKNVKVKRFH